MDITLYEKINRDKLQEVINCDNIIYEEQTWFEQFKKQLKNYQHRKHKKQGVEVIYTQKSNYGRYFSKGLALQGFQGDVRKYISGEYVRDFDFKNCHPVLLYQIMKKNNIFCGEFLEEYIKNREDIITKYNLKDKHTLIRVINSEKVPLEKELRQFHNLIYKEILPKLLLDESNKNLLARIKRERKKDKEDYNHTGAFISHYLQNAENDCLMSLFAYLNGLNIKIHSLVFDGLTIDINDSFDITEAEKYIQTQTGFTLSIVEKSMETDWKPIRTDKPEVKLETEDEKYSASKNLELFQNCFYIDEENQKKYDSQAICCLIDYINKFVCKVNYPHAYGWRNNTKDVYDLRSGEKVKDRIRFGFDCQDPVINWKNNDNSLLFNKFEFNPGKVVNENENYNLYIRPNIKECPENFEKEHLFFSFLKDIICNGDEALYHYLLNYIAKMVQVGKTGQAVVLLGGKGTGKSTFCEIMKGIIGPDYHQVVNDIERLTTNFNSIYEKCIITQVEEIVSNGADYHKVQNKLKTLITEDDIIIEKKGVDSYMSKSFNNYILVTNYSNPVNVTDDNRRFCIIRVSNQVQNAYEYFKRLRHSCNEQIEELRHFFYNYSFVDDLNSIRPKTEEEMDLVELNKSPEQKFIEQRLVLDLEPTHHCRTIEYIYDEYKQFCIEIKRKSLSKEYFSKMLKGSGYKTERLRCNGSRTFFVQGSTESKYNEILINEDDECVA